MTRFSKQAVAAALVMVLTASCAFKRAKYENPITKDTQQPDKILFDKAQKDVEHGRYEIARLTLNTLINTYDSSEFLAKAKLLIADSWYREGGPHGMAQAEAEYKDFILFYPTMEEAAESQEKICMIHYEQMDKPDRDPNNALRAEQECKQLILQFPNSKFAPKADQILRNIQEIEADAEMKTGNFYHKKGSNLAAANRYDGLVDQFPLYSKAGEALWEEADSYSRAGPRYRQKTGDALARLVRDYPLSPYADLAKKKLEELELPIPDPDPAAVARMKYEAENQVQKGFVSRSMSLFSKGPDVTNAAKAGTPTMDPPKRAIPASVPAPAGTAGFSGDVVVSPAANSAALDSKPDARSNPPATTTTADAAPQTTQQDPASTTDSKSKKKKKKNDKNDKNTPAPVATPDPASTTTSTTNP